MADDLEQLLVLSNVAQIGKVFPETKHNTKLAKAITRDTAFEEFQKAVSLMDFYAALKGEVLGKPVLWMEDQQNNDVYVPKTLAFKFYQQRPPLPNALADVPSTLRHRLDTANIATLQHVQKDSAYPDLIENVSIAKLFSTLYPNTSMEKDGSEVSICRGKELQVKVRERTITTLYAYTDTSYPGNEEGTRRLCGITVTKTDKGFQKKARLGINEVHVQFNDEGVILLPDEESLFVLQQYDPALTLNHRLDYAATLQAIVADEAPSRFSPVFLKR